MALRLRARGGPGTASQGGGGPVGDTQIGTGFDFTNHSASSSPGRLQGAMLFADGDVPATSAVVIKKSGTDLAVQQFDERAYWPSGCLRACVFAAVDTDFTGNESRTYVPFERSNTSFDNTGPRTLSDITGNTDINVQLSSFTEYDGSTTETRGSGAALASFNTIFGVATRRTRIHHGPARTTYIGWGYFKDGSDGSGSADAHLKCECEVSVWNDSGGSIADYEYSSVQYQNNWSTANKYRLNYTALLREGSTTKETFSSLQHYYNGGWAAVSMADDNNHGRDRWVTAAPTLIYKPDRQYLSDSNFVVIDLTATCSSAATIGLDTTIVPLTSQDHNPDLGATGSYQGRGLYPNSDFPAWLNQTAADQRSCIVNAQAVFACPRHFRSVRNRTRPTESADEANTVIAQPLDPQPSYDFTGDGMPAATNSYCLNSADSGVKDGYVVPLGGTGPWSNTDDSAHIPNHAYIAYILTGKRRYLQAMIDVATSIVHFGAGDEYSGRVKLWPAQHPNYAAAFSPPSTAYGAVGMGRIDNYRAFGWEAMMAGVAGLVPDNDPQCGYMRAHAKQKGDYAVACMAYMPQKQKDLGLWVQNKGRWKSWMTNFQAMGFAHLFFLTGDADAETTAKMFSNYCVNAWTLGNNFANFYTGQWLPKQLGEEWCQWHPSTNDFLLPSAGLSVEVSVTIDTGTDVFTLATNPSGIGTTGLALANGDKLYFQTYTEGDGVVTVPIGATEGTEYTLESVSGQTFKLTGVNISSGTSARVCFNLASWNDNAVAANPPQLPNPDDYAPINYAMLKIATRLGVTGASALVSQAETYMAPVWSTTEMNWRYA